MNDTEPRPQLTDEQLASWVNNVADGGVRHMLLELGEDLRASRAREAAQRTLREHAEHMKGELRAERDVLQQRIDKALAALPDASRYTVGAENALRVVSLLLDDIATARAALSGDAS